MIKYLQNRLTKLIVGWLWDKLEEHNYGVTQAFNGYC